MKKNANTSMKLVFALSGAAVVVIVALVIQQHRPTPTQIPVVTKPYKSEYVAYKPKIETVAKEVKSATIPDLPDLKSVVDEFEKMDQKITAESFADAFSKARGLYGAGQTFVWNGSEYSTNTADDLIPKPENQGDELLDSSGTGFAEIRIESRGDSNFTPANP